MERKELPHNLVKFFYTDPSEGKKNSDNAASGVFSIWEGNIVIWEVIAINHPFSTYIGHRDVNGDWVSGEYDLLVQRHGGTTQSIHTFENKSAGPQIVSYLKSRTNYRTKEDKIPNIPKLDRVKMCMSTIKTGRVILIDEGNWVQPFLDECQDFTGYGSNEIDDRVDVLSGIIRISMNDLVGSIFQYKEPVKEEPSLVEMLIN